MSVNDFTELMLGVRQQEEPEPEDPFEARRRVFHSQIRSRPDDTGYHNSFAVDICKFDERGKHVQTAKKCPHYDITDEEGPRVRPGWTAQRG